MLAGAHLSADKRLAEFDHPNWGFRFTFGFEIPLPRASDEFYTSVFIQQTSTTGLGKADKLEHSPDYFNKNPISLGVRVGI